MKGRVFLFAGVAVSISLALVSASAQAPSGGAAAAQAAAKTPWGDPDLQGIWTDDYTAPLQRSPQNAGKEFFTDAERAAMDKQRAGIQRREYRDRDASGKGTEQDVAGAYNTVFNSIKHTGR